jgi:hypothetical protein
VGTAPAKRGTSTPSAAVEAEAWGWSVCEEWIISLRRRTRLGLRGTCGQPQSDHRDARQQRPGNRPKWESFSDGAIGQLLNNCVIFVKSCQTP